MTQVRERYEKRYPHNEWQYELRVRYVPRDMKELLEKDRVTFYYFYDQVSLRLRFFLAPYLLID